MLPDVVFSVNRDYH